MNGHFAGKIFDKIFIKNPGHVRNAIEKKPIHMLVPVHFAKRLMGMQPHKRFYINVGVCSVDIGEGVMVDVVFDFPIMCIASQRV